MKILDFKSGEAFLDEVQTGDIIKWDTPNSSYNFDAIILQKIPIVIVFMIKTNASGWLMREHELNVPAHVFKMFKIIRI